MQLQPIVYVTNMDRSTEWYELLLARPTTVASEHWTTFSLGGATLALHHVDHAQPEGAVALSLVATEPLEKIASRMGNDEIIDQPFGRSFVVEDPDGTRIQVNEHRDD